MRYVGRGAADLQRSARRKRREVALRPAAVQNLHLIGKAFRNEINPRNFTFRSREFEQAELEFFCHPGDGVALVRPLARW